jgi:hypothetical protein
MSSAIEIVQQKCWEMITLVANLNTVADKKSIKVVLDPFYGTWCCKTG